MHVQKWISKNMGWLFLVGNRLVQCNPPLWVWPSNHAMAKHAVSIISSIRRDYARVAARRMPTMKRFYRNDKRWYFTRPCTQKAHHVLFVCFYWRRRRTWRPQFFPFICHLMSSLVNGKRRPLYLQCELWYWDVQGAPPIPSMLFHLWTCP